MDFTNKQAAHGTHRKHPTSSRQTQSKQRALAASIRCDVIVKLEPFLKQQEENESTNVSSWKKSDAAVSMCLPLRRRLEGGSQPNRSNTNDNGTKTVGENNNGSSAGRTGRRLISNMDRNTIGIKTYPYRLAENLSLCERVVKAENNIPKVECGFECIHCSLFRRFPQTKKEVEKEIKNFRSHMTYCSGVPLDLRSFLNWMNRRSKLDKSLYELISYRLDEHAAKGNAALKKARKRKRKQMHSILENV